MQQNTHNITDCPMALEATTLREKDFWNALAQRGAKWSTAVDKTIPMPIGKYYGSVRKLAIGIREMLLSEEDNREISLNVRIVPEAPFPERDAEGNLYLPNTTARITITTDDALQFTPAMLAQLQSLLPVAQECHSTLTGIITNGKYGISMNIFCNVPMFRWPKSLLEDML